MAKQMRTKEQLERKKLYDKEYKLKNKEKFKEYKKEYYTKNKEYILNKNADYHSKMSDNQKINKLDKTKDWQNNNREKVNKYNLEYYYKNKETVLPRQKQYIANKYKTDINYKLRTILSTIISKQIKKANIKKSKSSLKIVGLPSWNDFKNYIESQFTEGMSWNNYGIGANNDTWHIDHIKPISSGINEDEIYSLNHYTNLRPMWCSDNIRKSNKF